MAKLKDFIVRINDDFTIEYKEGIVDYLLKHSFVHRGYGQDIHTSDVSPEYSVFMLKGSDKIEHEGVVYTSLSFEYSSNELYLQESYDEANYNAREIDGRGSGYEIIK